MERRKVAQRQQTAYALFKLLKEAVRIVEDLSYYLVDNQNYDEMEKWLQKTKKLIEEREG